MRTTLALHRRLTILLALAPSPPAQAIDLPAPLLLIAQSPEALPLAATLQGQLERRGHALVTVRQLRQALHRSPDDEGVFPLPEFIPAHGLRRNLQQARDLALQMKREEAIALLQRIMEGLDNVDPRMEVRDLAWRASLQLATVLELEQRGMEARRVLDRALRHQPEGRPDPAVDHPRVIEAWHEATQDLRRLARTDLHIDTDPEGCFVTVDGLAVGPSPQRLSLPAGEVLIRAYCFSQSLASRAYRVRLEGERAAVHLNIPLDRALALSPLPHLVYTGNNLPLMAAKAVGARASLLVSADGTFRLIPVPDGKVLSGALDRAHPLDSLLAPSPQVGEEGSPWYSSWWLWSAVGLAVTAATATALAVTLSPSDSPDQGRLVIQWNP